MGETLPLLQTSFNRSLRVEARPERLTAEAGAVLLRESLERSGIVRWMVDRLRDPRREAGLTYLLPDLLRTAILLPAMGWRDHDDADALRHDPALRLATSHRASTAPLDENRHLASQSTMSRLTAALAVDDNRSVLRESILEMAARRLRASRRGRRARRLTIDVDSLPVEVHGHQPGSEWNGHYNGRIYHPLIASVAETGDMLDGRLRPGNAHTAAGGLDFILNLVDRAERALCRVAMVRMDAGFPAEPLLAGLEARGIDFVARLRTNKVLDRMAAPHLKRPRGRPPKTPRVWLHEKTYQAASWSRERRVVLVVVERQDDLFLDHFWLVTSLPAARMDAHALLAHYRQRGTAEGHMGEVMDVLSPALSSSQRPKEHYRGRPPRTRSPSVDAFACNEVRLLVALLAYEVMHTARTVLQTVTRTGWSLRRLRERVLRVAARLTISGRRVTMIIDQASADIWHRLWPKLVRLHWAGP